MATTGVTAGGLSMKLPRWAIIVMIGQTVVILFLLGYIFGASRSHSSGTSASVSVPGNYSVISLAPNAAVSFITKSFRIENGVLIAESEAENNRMTTHILSGPFFMKKYE
jgi:hypothetical protein